jgi:hypothetical protein
MLNEGNQIDNVILCVCENFGAVQLFNKMAVLVWTYPIILLRFRNRNWLRFRFQLFNKLRFRFRFHTAESYGSYGSGSTTLLKIIITCSMC